MAAIGQLSAGLAHEVKNPLAGILGFAQLSKRKIDDPVALRSNLDVIERETRRCSEIIGSLMQFARQERPERQPTDVNAAVQHALSIVDHQLSLKKVRIVRELAPALPVVLGNANQLEQALINLMINAQQAMQPDGGQVTVRTTYEGDRVLVSVEDTGPGVPEEIRQRIFEPFFTTKKVGQGTGLGLSVTYGLIKDHGGDIRVGSGSTGGALFTIVLPAQSDPGRQVPADAATLQGSQAA
jgi:signal transduction histidine kinase